MKKLLKVVIALVIIVAIAVGAYFIFGGNTDNSQISYKVNEINKMEYYKKVNNTLTNMVEDINKNSYDMQEIKTYFVVYNQSVSNYQIVIEEIYNNSIFLNSNNTGNYYKNMNDSYTALIKSYNDAESYLSRTYWLSASKDYIINFYNIFKNTLTNLNSFYYNAGMAYLIATDNTMSTNNLYKLNLECYLSFANCYVENYLENLENNLNILTNIDAKAVGVKLNNFEEYVNNYNIYNDLMGGGINKRGIVKKYIAGDINDYLSQINNEQQKSREAQYYNLIVK